MEKNLEPSQLKIEDIWPPRDLVTKSMYKLNRESGGVTKQLIDFLRSQNVPAVPVPRSEKSITPDLDDAIHYFQTEITFVKRHYPDGYRYNDSIERMRVDAKIQEKAIGKKDYVALIRCSLEESLRESQMAKRLAENYAKKPQSEKDDIERFRKEAVESVKKFNQTGNRDDLGFPPGLFEASGVEDQARSRMMLGYAIVLAKEVDKK